MSSKKNTPRVAGSVVRKFAEYRDAMGGWADLGGVFDDGHFDDMAVCAVLDSTRESGNDPGEILASLLMDMSVEQREYLANALKEPAAAAPVKPNPGAPLNIAPLGQIDAINACIRLRVPASGVEFIDMAILQSRELDVDYAARCARAAAQAQMEFMADVRAKQADDENPGTQNKLHIPQDDV